jgi:hypothetical protein
MQEATTLSQDAYVACKQSVVKELREGTIASRVGTGLDVSAPGFSLQHEILSDLELDGNQIQ